MTATITEIAEGIWRLNVHVPEIGPPKGFGFNSFLIFIVGGLVTGLAIWLELAASPPFWLHVLLWLPLTVLLVVGLLRISKGLLLALEYRHRAREGRIAPPE